MNRLRELMVLGLFLSGLCAQDQVWTVGALHTGTGEVHAPGRIVVRDGRIIAVGTAAAIAVPAGATHHEHPKAVLHPGLIDAWSRHGAESVLRETTSAFQWSTRVADEVDLHGKSLRGAAQAGVTTAVLAPGERNVVGGRAAFLSLRPAGAGRALRDGPLCVSFTEGRWDRELPPTNVWGAIEALQEAGQDARHAELFAPEVGLLVVTSPGRSLEASLRLSRAGLPRPVVVADWTAARQAEALQKGARGLVLRGLVPEPTPGRDAALRELFAGDLVIALGSGGAGTRGGLDLRLGAVTLARAGVAPERILRALTQDAARLHGLPQGTGTLAVNAPADFVVATALPSDPRAHVEAVVAGGHLLNGEEL